MTNIVFIVADDLGWGDVGYHKKDAVTPFIDQLAHEGTRLENFYVQPSCSPTRAAFMTGRYPYKIGIQRVLWPWSQHGIEPHIKLLPAYLKEAGYQTAIFGKWNLGHAKECFLPTRRGFEYHYGSYTGSVDHFSHEYYGVHDLNENEKAVYDKGHLCDLVTDKAIEKLQSRDKKKPFFYYIPFNSPHAPIQYPAYFKRVFEDRHEKRSDLLAMIQHLDYCIGRIIAALGKEGVLDDTFIWLSSDNGGWLEIGSSNGSLSGGKANASCLGIGDGSIRAVNFIYWSATNRIRNCNHMFHAIDVLPTLCALAGCEHTTDIDGVNLLPYLRAKNPPKRILTHILMGNSGDSIFGCCRNTEGFKYICSGDKEELYNTNEDPTENQNLTQSQTEVKDELRKHLTNQFEYYKPDPVMWTKPNGYPDGFVFPKDWNKIRKRKSAKILQSHIFDFEKETPVEILGYYNICNQNQTSHQ